MTRRILRGLAAAGLLVALTAGAASAGGWATIQSDAGNPPQPNAGEPFTFGFTVLQHGITPAGWESPTFLGTNTATGERVEAKAVAQGADGHFVATVTIPSAGFWTWQVVLADLIVETAPQQMVVALNGVPPAMDTGSVLAALEGVRSEYKTLLGTETEALRAQIAQLETSVATLQNQRAALSKQVQALTATPPAAALAPVTEPLPLFAVIGIAVLAGAISGFAMTMLGRTERPGRTAADGAAEELAPSSGTLTTR